MRVLCDAIHASLADSLRLLLEERLGMEVYRPIGMEWHERGIWRFDATRPWGVDVAHQFLDPWDSDVPYPTGGYSSRASTTYPGTSQRLVTYEQARSEPWDIILSTLAENDPGWHGFAQEVGAHFGVQVGNQDAPVAWPLAEFALLSVTTPGFTPWKPHVYYRQEFSLEDFAADAGSGALDSREVQTRVQCAATSEGYHLFRELARRTAGELDWRWYGHCGEPDEHFGGDAPTTQLVADQMHRARIAWHWKRWSDGYGHVIHNWSAIGRPMFVTRDYYQDKLAGPLFTDANSWNLERLGVDELEQVIRRLATDDAFYQEACIAASDRFREVVDFDAEAEAIGELLARVL